MKERNDTELQKPGRLEYWIKSDQFKLIACRVHKAGSTNTARVMYTLDHLSAQRDTNEIRRGMARHNAAFEKKYKTAKSFEMEYKSYKKFLFIREPLERLLSAYRAKLPHGMFKSNTTFTEFLERVLSIPDKDIDKHLISITGMCSPCSIKYDFVGLVDSYGDDMRRILDSVNATILTNVTLPERNQTGYMMEKSSDALQTYMKDVPKSLVRGIYEKYYWDYFLFGFDKPTFNTI